MITKYKLMALMPLLLIFFLSCEDGTDEVAYEGTVYLPMSGVADQVPLLGESIYDVGVYWAGVNQTESNVTVNLALDQDALDDYIAANPGYELLPAKYYDIPNSSVSLSSEREYCKIHFKNIDPNFVNKKYILPLSIQNVNPSSIKILDTKKTSILRFSRYRNAYECYYKAYGTVTTEGSTSSPAKIDEQYSAMTASPNAITVKGAENTMKLLLTVQGDGSVVITGAPGSEAFNIKNTDGKKSTYTGSFDTTYQTNRGSFLLYYTYTLNAKQMFAEVELKSWL